MQKWLKKLQKYLDGAENAASDFAGVELPALFPVLLRLAMHASAPVVAALPDAVAVDQLRVALDETLRLLHSPLRVLYIPEAGRGKLLFPGGESRRARALNLALSGEFDLLVGSVHALLGPAPPPAETREAVLTLHPGMRLAPRELAARLVKLDYDDEFEVTTVGEFSLRGGIVDFYSPAHDFPCRVEFFGDEIESLRGFAVETQRSTGEIAEYRCIGRAGITAGGAAESDVFDYLGERDFQLAVFHPEAAFDILGKYSVPGAEKRLEKLMAERRERSRLSMWYDFAGPGGALPPDVLPSVVDYAGGVSASGASELALAAVRSRLREALRAGDCAVWFAAHAEDIGLLRKWAENEHLSGSGVEFAVGALPGGFQIPGEGLLALTEAEAAALGFRWR